jgi:phenylalanyl-tRNA synthetase beta chain
MIVSWNWLKELVRLDMPVDRLVERLTMAGLNHEATADVEGDLAIDIEVTSNRPDCLGHLGIAREIAVLFDREFTLPPSDFAETDAPIGEWTSIVVQPEAARWCPQYRARVISDVHVGPSPDWLARRLRAVGLTPINNVVDITNYVLLECGQPLHAFDYDKLDQKRIVVRNAYGGEMFLAINNRRYELSASMGVIADGRRAVAIAGVMGGAETEVTQQTKTVLLESAEFTPIEIRRTSRALDLASESSYRFERKIDPLGVAWASDRACRLLCELAGGKVARGAIHIGPQKVQREPIRLRWARIPRIFGIDVPRDRMARIFRGLGLTIVEEAAESVVVIPPAHRRDLTREIDLIEEVGRIHGYDAVPEDRVIPLCVAPVRKLDRVLDRVRDALIGFGLCEAVTFSFTDAQTLALIRPWSAAAPLSLKHSSRKHENRLRQSLLPSLLQVYRLNEARGNKDIRLFEIAVVYLPRTGRLLPDEPLVLGLVSDQDFRAVRGQIESILARFEVGSELRPAPVPGLAADRSAEFRLDGKRVGVIGALDDSIRKQLDLRSEPVLAELALAPLVERAELTVRAQPIATQPSVVRDLAFVLDESVLWADLEAAARAAAGDELESLEFVDLYRGKQIEPGKKSIAMRLTYRSHHRTLTHAEVDGYQRQVITAVETKLGGKLR